VRRVSVILRVALLVNMALFARVVRGGIDTNEAGILSLAHSGQNAEAIAAYEALPDRDQVDVDVLRAVAGAYWRERRFEEARVLYRTIMKRQSNLNSLGPNDAVASEGSDMEAVADQDTTPQGADEVDEPVAMSPSPDMPDDTLGESATASPEPEVVDANVTTAMSTDTDVGTEIAQLKAELSALQAEREQSRLSAETRIAELTADAAEKATQMEALQAQLQAASDDSESDSVPEKGEPDSRVSALATRIEQLERDLSAARQIAAKLETDADQKINDLLDSIAHEKANREKAEADLIVREATLADIQAQSASDSAALQLALDKAHRDLKQARSLAEAAATDHELREVELRAKIATMSASGEQAKLQIVMLEEALATLRGQLESVQTKLSDRNHTLSNELERVGNDSLELALDEIERLESEQAASDALAATQLAELQETIKLLEAETAGDQEALAALKNELEDERRQRSELEKQTQSQLELLSEKETLLAEAKQALSRQYDALREHLQGGTTIRLENGDDAVDDAIVLSPDLVPMIGQLEAATATAVETVNSLREKLDHEREIFEKALQDKETELDALRTELADNEQRLQEMAASATRDQSALEAEHARAIAAMAKEHESAVNALKSEIETLRNVLASRDQAVAMLEDELTAERAGTARVLSLARQTEETLTARIRQLETNATRRVVETVVTDTEEPAAPSALTPVIDDAVFDSILEMVASDKAAAIDRFETLPTKAEMPDRILKAMGNLYRERGNYAAARDLFQTLVNRHPDDAYAERKLVMTLFDMGLYDAALSRLSEPRETATREREMK
jgi:predicted  nucleic acid-binding Zn-ribbon protein